MHTVGVALIKLLEDYGVNQVFGIPGVHTIELYRGLADSSITHHTPRHEQGAGFMADGYARVSGKPGVCFVITGPGLTNIATAMGQALADSIPMLIISSVNDHICTPFSQGNLHEMPNQSAMIAHVSRYSQTVSNEAELASALAGAFAVFSSDRPGPVHLQIPVSILGKQTDRLYDSPIIESARIAPDKKQIDRAVSILQNAKTPVLLIGGGARHAAAEITELTEKLDAPAHLTINARGVIRQNHPLALPASCSMRATRELLNEADVVLAIGTELAPTDYDMYRDHQFALSGKLIRCDIDVMQIQQNFQPDVALIGDAQITARAIADQLQQCANEGENRTKKTMTAANAELGDEARFHLQLLERIQHQLPGSILVGDSTQLIYSGNMIHNTGSPNTWFNSSVGFGTLGYALPAAIGASIATSTKKIQQTSEQQTHKTQTQTQNQHTSVLCLIGDGGLQFVLGELGTLKDSNAVVAIIVWCNNGYREIKTSMENADVTTVGVDLVVPDFSAIANAYGIKSANIKTLDELSTALDNYQNSTESMLIAIDEQALLDSAGIDIN